MDQAAPLKSMIHRYLTDLVRQVPHVETSKVNLRGIVRHQLGLTDQEMKVVCLRLIKIRFLEVDQDSQIDALVDDMLMRNLSPSDVDGAAAGGSYRGEACLCRNQDA